MYSFLYLIPFKSIIFTEFTVVTNLVVSKSCYKQFLVEHEIQKLQTPGEDYAAELPGNESEHVTKDSHSSFSLGLLLRKFVSS